MVCIIDEGKRQNTQRFDGLIYNYLMSCTTKEEAEERKKVGKQWGTINRIVKVTGGYDLYVSGKLRKRKGKKK